MNPSFNGKPQATVIAPSQSPAASVTEETGGPTSDTAGNLTLTQKNLPDSRLGTLD